MRRRAGVLAAEQEEGEEQAGACGAHRRATRGSPALFARWRLIAAIEARIAALAPVLEGATAGGPRPARRATGSP